MSRTRWQRWLAPLAGAVLVATGFVVVAGSGAAGASTITTTITRPGETAYTVPLDTVSLQVTVVGAAGSTLITGGEPPGTPGSGAEVVATIVPTTGELYAEVGSIGVVGSSDYGGLGGGESAIQTCSNTDNTCTYTADPSSDPRLVVAGGGGGGGEDSFAASGSGGTGGSAGATASVTGPGAGGAGTASGNGDAGSTAGLGDDTSVASGGSTTSGCATEGGGGGTGGTGAPGGGGKGGTAGEGDDSSGGAGGGGWEGGSGGGAGDCPGGSGGSGGGGGAGASFVESGAADVSVSEAGLSATPEVIITATVGPVVTTSGGSASFVAGDNTSSTPIDVDPGVTVTDSASSTLASGTVVITGNFQSAEDFLAFTNTSADGNITGSYDSTTGVLTLTSSGATATVAQWQNALESVTYTDSAITPNDATRTVSFNVTDADGVSSITAARTVTVTDTDQTPIVTTTAGTTNYVVGATAAVIDSGVTVSDRGDTTLASGTLEITSGFQAVGDVLVFTNTSATIYGNIIGSYDSTTGVLTLTSSGATASVGQWQNALESVTFSTVSTTLGDRTVSFVVNDGIENSLSATKTVDVVPQSQAEDNTDSIDVTEVGTSVDSSTTATGNLLANAQNLFTDPSTITSVANTKVPAGVSPVSGVITIDGQYGTLVVQTAGLNAGDYTYTLDSGVVPSCTGGTDIYNYTLADNYGLSSSANLTVTLDVSCLASGPSVALSAMAGRTTGSVVVGSFTDSNTAAAALDFTASVNWGDGTMSSGTVGQPGGAGTPFVVNGTHTYATTGLFDFTVDASGDGGTVMLTGTVNVQAPPGITSANSVTFYVGHSNTFNVTTSGAPTPTVSETGTLPPWATFAPGAGGTATLAGTPTSTGTYSFSFIAANNVLPNATQPFTLNVVGAPSFSVSVPASATAWNPFSFTVTALNPNGTVDTGYSGTVVFSSSDPSAVMSPNPATLTKGKGTFMATLATPDSRTITATDSVIPAFTGTSTAISVGYPYFSVSVPSSATAGNLFSFSVTALNPNGTVDHAYGGTVHFTSSHGAASLPVNSTLSAGKGSFTATLESARSQTITATDTVHPAITGVSNAISVAEPYFSVSVPARATTGTSFTFTVTALNPNGTVDSAYGGTVDFSANTGLVAFVPTSSKLTSGRGTFSATFSANGSWTITAKDSVTPAITGTSNSISVS